MQCNIPSPSHAMTRCIEKKGIWREELLQFLGVASNCNFRLHDMFLCWTFFNRSCWRLWWWWRWWIWWWLWCESVQQQQRASTLAKTFVGSRSQLWLKRLLEADFRTQLQRALQLIFVLSFLTNYSEQGKDLCKNILNYRGTKFWNNT